MYENIINRAYVKYYSPNDKIWDNWNYKEFPFGSGKRDIIISKIKELLKKGYKVKCGYTTTSVRNYYTRYIFYKQK